jgi:hypothetical protein
MPEFKRSFLRSKMNKDLDERLIPSGEYRDALNIEISTSETGDVGAIESSNGNIKPGQFINLGYDNSVCIGTATDTENDRIYWFIAGDTLDRIFEYDLRTDYILPILVDHKATSGGILNFSADNYITAANVIHRKASDGTSDNTESLLFFTDDVNEPKKININRFKSQENSFNSMTTIYGRSAKERDITVIKQYPLNAPNIQLFRSLREGSVNSTFIDTNGDAFTLGVGNSDPKAYGTSISLTINDVPNYEVGDRLVFKATDQNEVYSVRAFITTTPTLTSTSTSFTVKILSTSEKLIAVANTVWQVELEEQDVKFEDKFPRFAYRWRYNDDEYSAFSPFTNIAFLPDNEDFVYDNNKGYNVNMANSVRKIVLNGLDALPPDAKEVDILYKLSNDTNVYLFETLKNGETELTITRELIENLIEENQILRSFDSVPKKAKAQTITANRLMYGNYVLGHNFDQKVKINSRVESSLVQENNPQASVKSMRDYQLGVVYLDEYGRQSPVFSSSKDAGIYIPLEDADKKNIIQSQITSQPPEWATHFKYYIKDSSNEYNNLITDRYYNGEKGNNFWISVPSSERNKVDIGTYLVLKKKHGSNVAFNPRDFGVSSAKFKILDVKNEVPDFIKTKKRLIGSLTAVSLFPSTLAGYPRAGYRTFRIPGDVIGTDSSQLRDIATNSNFINQNKYLKIKSSDSTQSTDLYQIESITKVDGDGSNPPVYSGSNDYYEFTLMKSFSEDSVWLGSYKNYTNNTTIEIYAEERSNDDSEYVGRFFIKLRRDSLITESIFGYADGQFSPVAVAPFKLIDFKDTIYPTQCATGVLPCSQGEQPSSGPIYAGGRFVFEHDLDEAGQEASGVKAFGTTAFILGEETVYKVGDAAVGPAIGNKVLTLRYIDYGIDGVIADTKSPDTSAFAAKNPETGESEQLQDDENFHRALADNNNLYISFVSDPNNTKYKITAVNIDMGRNYAYNKSNKSSSNRCIRYVIFLEEPIKDWSPLSATTGGLSTRPGKLSTLNVDNQRIAKIRQRESETVQLWTKIPSTDILDTASPAVWETVPEQPKVDLDLYYEASDAYPVVQVGMKVTGTGIASNTTVSSVTNFGFFNLSNNTTAAITNGIINLESADGNYNFNLTVNVNNNANVVTIADGQVHGQIHTLGTDRDDDTDIASNDSYKSWFNCFSFGNGVESNRIRDDFNAPFIDKGPIASTTLDEPYTEERRKNSIIYSGIYNPKSGVNKTNQFIIGEKITKDINDEYGSIQKLHTRAIDIIALCEDKIVKVLANKDALFNADGNPQLIATDRVLGQAIPYAGSYGISKNPESFAAFGNRVYFSDKDRGKVFRLSGGLGGGDGLTDISGKGMSDYFSDNLAIASSVIGSYDQDTNTYNITLNDDTVSFKEAVDGWPSRKSFIPEWGVSLNNKYFTFKDGYIWLHSHDENKNTFYGGSQADSTIDIVFNDAPGSVKKFKTLNYEGDSGWTASTLTTDQENGGDILFKEKEGKWFAYLKHNKNYKVKITPKVSGSASGNGGQIILPNPVEISNVYSTTMSNTLTFTIKPKEGYEFAAPTVGDILPSAEYNTDVLSASSKTATITNGNLVLTIDLAGFNLPPQDINEDLPINVTNYINLKKHTIGVTYKKYTSNVTISSAGGSPLIAATASNNATGTTSSGRVNEKKLIYSATITPSSGYAFNDSSKPRVVMSGEGNYTIIGPTANGSGYSFTVNGFVVNKNITGELLKVYADPVVSVTESTTSIYGADFSQNKVNKNGEKREITVFGSPSAQVVLNASAVSASGTDLLININDGNGFTSGSKTLTMDSDGKAKATIKFTSTATTRDVYVRLTETGSYNIVTSFDNIDGSADNTVLYTLNQLIDVGLQISIRRQDLTTAMTLFSGPNIYGLNDTGGQGNTFLARNIDFENTTATLSTGIASVTVADTTGFGVGDALLYRDDTNTTGRFGTNAVIQSVDSATTFTASVNHATAGAIDFQVNNLTTDALTSSGVANEENPTTNYQGVVNIIVARDNVVDSSSVIVKVDDLDVENDFLDADGNNAYNATLGLLELKNGTQLTVDNVNFGVIGTSGRGGFTFNYTIVKRGSADDILYVKPANILDLSNNQSLGTDKCEAFLDGAGTYITTGGLNIKGAKTFPKPTAADQDIEFNFEVVFDEDAVGYTPSNFNVTYVAASSGDTINGQVMTSSDWTNNGSDAVVTIPADDPVGLDKFGRIQNGTKGLIHLKFKSTAAMSNNDKVGATVTVNLYT